ncbi:MAG: hypothetical protein FJ295_00515 [Planctomycetes bacterium]|nr:hypothetical protein [Planctomycetota bacterium]
MTIENPHRSPNARSLAKLGTLPDLRRNWTDYSPKYNVAFKTAILVQAVLAIVTKLVLDFPPGQTHRAFWVALVCQWSMVWIILFRRPMHPTRFDLFLVRYGIVPLLFLVAGVGPWYLRMLGVQT